jgi:hypothetical protein
MWRKTLDTAKRSPLVLKVCTSPKQLSQFVESNKLLESVQKGLSDYLETKRLAFARFFFLSNDELLQILSQAQVRGAGGREGGLSSGDRRAAADPRPGPGEGGRGGGHCPLP